MSADEKANCSVHGEQQRTYVCQHIYAGLVARERVGWFWSVEDPDNPRPDAYCRECEIRVRKAGGDWTGEALEHLQPKILCGLCYDLAKQFHRAAIPGVEPWNGKYNIGKRSEVKLARGEKNLSALKAARANPKTSANGKATLEVAIVMQGQINQKLAKLATNPINKTDSE